MHTPEDPGDSTGLAALRRNGSNDEPTLNETEGQLNQTPLVERGTFFLNPEFIDGNSSKQAESNPTKNSSQD